MIAPVPPVAWFRFHTGSIKSADRHLQDRKRHDGFDSILVRLKVTHRDMEITINREVSIPYWFD